MHALKWLWATFFVVVLATIGCSREVKEKTAEEIPQADTATVEASASPESSPVVEQGNLAPLNEEQEIPSEQNQASQPTQAVQTAPMNKPVPTQQEEPAAPISGEWATYTIQQGDTLMKIAFNVYGDILKWHYIYEMNKDTIRSANSVSPGMTLKYERPATEPVIEKNGDPYFIKHGDTLGSIAGDLYGKRSKWKKLWKNNHALIKDPNKIYAGFYLYYQMSEAEKRAAEHIKTSRTQQKQLASKKVPTTQFKQAHVGLQKQVMPKMTKTPVAPTENNQAAEGLSNLITLPSGRSPAGK